MFWSSVPFIRSLKSAGQFIVNFVIGLMVGVRRFPGATLLGVETFYLLSQPSLFSPAGLSRTRDGSFFLSIVTGAFVFWVFGSLFKSLRRPSGLLLRQRQSQRKTLRRHGRLLLRQLHTQNELQPET